MILRVYPRRGIVIGNSSEDSMGNQLPSHARLFTLLDPANVPMIYNGTLQLVKDHTVVCDEILFTIKTNLPEVCFSRYYQNGNVLNIEYPLPKIKLTGQWFYNYEHYLPIPWGGYRILEKGFTEAQTAERQSPVKGSGSTLPLKRFQFEIGSSKIDLLVF